MTNKTIEMHIAEGYDAFAKRVTEAWHRAEAGEDVQEFHVSFVDSKTYQHYLDNS